MVQRTFDADEVAEILERAARLARPSVGRPVSLAQHPGPEMTLSEIQAMGAEAGIPADRIAAVTRDLMGAGDTGYPVLAMKLRMP